jgi:hypothetical protein
MNNPDHISESLKTIFKVKILKFCKADPGWEKFGSGIRNKHPGSATLQAIEIKSGHFSCLTPNPNHFVDTT